MANYVTVKLPEYLVQQIDNVLEQEKFGYLSRAEFVKDAVRVLLAMTK